MAVATRLTSNGILYNNGSFDEVTKSSNSTDPTTVYSAEFDEVTNNNSGVAKREIADGKLLVSGYFDEFTGAPIIDTSTKLWLDSAIPQSYSGSGSTWTDLTPNNKNATFVSSPTFENINGGVLNYKSAESDYATVSDLGSLTRFTVEAWVKFNSIPTTNKFPAIVTNTYPGGSNLNFSLGFNGANGTGFWNGRLCGGFFNGAWRNTLGFIPVINTWYNVCVTYDGSTVRFYNNGVQDSFLTYTGTPASSGAGIRIARRWDDIDYIDGYIPVVRIYNRALSASDVKANYDALKKRF